MIPTISNKTIYLIEKYHQKGNEFYHVSKWNLNKIKRIHYAHYTSLTFLNTIDQPVVIILNDYNLIKKKSAEFHKIEKHIKWDENYLVATKTHLYLYKIKSLNEFLSKFNNLELIYISLGDSDLKKTNLDPLKNVSKNEQVEQAIINKILKLGIRSFIIPKSTVTTETIATKELSISNFNSLNNTFYRKYYFRRKIKQLKGGLIVGFIPLLLGGFLIQLNNEKIVQTKSNIDFKIKTTEEKITKYKNLLEKQKNVFVKDNSIYQTSISNTIDTIIWQIPSTIYLTDINYALDYNINDKEFIVSNKTLVIEGLSNKPDSISSWLKKLQQTKSLIEINILGEEKKKNLESYFKLLIKIK